MNPTRRWTSAALGLLLGAGIGTVATAAPASATVTTLCSGYTSCASKGMGDAGYAAASRTMYWRMYSGHNCTNYAAYRMVRAGLPNVRPWTGSGNATNWGSAMSRLTTSTPTVGAVAWWRAGVKPAGSVGHVGYVEKVVSPDEILVSQDSWNGDFSWTRITRASSGWPSGFVHFADVRLLNAGLPSVVGNAKVGSPLTATIGAWSVAGTTFSYQWYADGVAVPQATGSTLTPARDQVGKRLTVRVTASLLGFSAATAESAPSQAVAPGVLGSTAAPTVSGEAGVDLPLAAAPGDWNPSPDRVDYRWQADGRPVAGAQDAVFTPGVDEVGKAISVVVVASKNGYPQVSRTSEATAPVARGTLALPARPTVVGSTRPGQVLDVALPQLPDGATTSVIWRRANVAVPGARGATYAVTPADLGSRLVAQVQVVKPGYTPVTMRTVSSDVVRTSSSIRLSAAAGTRRLSLRGTVVTRDVPAVDGVLQVRSRGRLLRSVPVIDGRVSATVTRLHRGTRTYRFRLLTSATVLGGAVERRLTIR